MVNALKRVSSAFAILGVVLFVFGTLNRGITGGDAAGGFMIALLFGTIRALLGYFSPKQNPKDQPPPQP
jgi:membrane-bound ClpP family serine protease